MSVARKCVHFIGSFPQGSYESVEDLLVSTCRALPGRLRRIPDGELGDRYNYCAWQVAVFPPTFLFFNEDPILPPEEVKAALQDLEPCGYDDAAVKSYGAFREAKEAGLIPRDVRFQVSTPLPMEVVCLALKPAYRAITEPVYEELLMKAVRTIQDKIPANELAIQFDICAGTMFLEHEQEPARLDGKWVSFAPWFSPVFEGLVERIVRAVAAIDRGVELGFHLCYGDTQHAHIVQPHSTALLVKLANTMASRLTQQISWIHMPVPKDRSDPAYFEPLRNLQIGDAQLVLGLVHPEDLAGTKQRINAAFQAYPKGFAVATECGMGRTPNSLLESIFNIMEAVAAPF